MKPIFNLRDKNLSASCFERTVEKDGKTFNFKTVVIQRSYKKKGDNEYTHEQINLTPDELLKVSRLCISAYSELLVKAVQSDDLPNDDIPF